MKLIYSAASPYARKARVTAIESGVGSELEFEDILPWEDPAGYRDVNPVGKVPVMTYLRILETPRTAAQRKSYEKRRKFAVAGLGNVY